MSMHRGFWDKLPRPFFILAPMYDVTDVAFRHVVTQCGRPDVYFTEFVSTDGLTNETGRERLQHHLFLEEADRPIVAQIFGAKPEKFYETAKLVRELGFDGVDINMGCPDKNIIKGGSCAALFKTPDLAREIIEATWHGATETRPGHAPIPVSVKIRIGDTKVDWQPWIATLLKAKPAALSIHLRTRKEMSKVPAHWELMPDIVQFIHDQTTQDERPLIVGNGDVETLSEAREKIINTRCDGVMIGRGIFQNPWLFGPDADVTHSIQEKANLLLLHVQTYEQYFTGVKSFDPLKRFYKIYINGFDGAAELREKLYGAEDAASVAAILKTEGLV